jgi:hypothetical protein
VWIFFGEDIVNNTNPSQTQYHNPQANAPYYPRHANLPINPQSTYIPQDLNHQLQQTLTFTTPLHPQYDSNFHDIIEKSPSQVPITPSSATETPTSSVLPSPMKVGPSEKKRKKADPSYDASWWRFYEQTKDASGVILSGRCNVKNYKAFYKYSKLNGISAFKNHADKYLAKNKEPQDQPDPRLVQNVINTDDSRTHQRYDQKRMLSEFVRYIIQKEQPISMDNCLSFARLVIRGCGQPLYKRFHNRKMVAEIKRQYNKHKNNLLATFGYANYKVSITFDI